MKRSHLVSGPLAVLALTLTACGSSGSKTLSEDDFVTQMNAICRTADRGITDLDPTDKSFYSDASDIIQTGLDGFAKLKAPKSLKSDFDDYVSDVEDTQTQIDKLGKAVKAGDNDAAQTASDKLDKLDKDSNDLADSIGAEKCKDVGGSADTADTTPDTTDTTDTTDTVVETTDSIPETTDSVVETTDSPETTDAPETTENTPNTPLSIDTSPETLPVNTATQDTTSTGGGVTASDASTVFNPIAGYTWGVLEDLNGAGTPTNNSVLGSVLSAYEVGVMDNTTDGSQVYIWVTILNQDSAWTQQQLDAYYTYELVGDGGISAATPEHGFPARSKTGVAEGLDGAVFTLDGDPENGPALGVSLVATAGTDMLALLDSFADAQGSMGG